MSTTTIITTQPKPTKSVHWCPQKGQVRPSHAKLCQTVLLWCQDLFVFLFWEKLLFAFVKSDTAEISWNAPAWMVRAEWLTEDFVKKHNRPWVRALNERFPELNVFLGYTFSGFVLRAVRNGKGG